MIPFILIILIVFILPGYPAINQYEDPNEGCTIGVASGRATTDGRPLVWKTRDASAVDNMVYYNTSYNHHFIAVISAGATAYSWMGVNEKGLAILNSASSDLPSGSSGMGNGSIMTHALGNCVTVAEFEALLELTNSTGRQTQANFGVIDTTGAAAIFETGGNVYWKFDANDSSQAPQGYILRTNFAINGGGSGGIERYRRTVDLMERFYSGDSLNHKSILRYQMRDFSDYSSNPFPIPYPHQISLSYPFGYIYTDVSICRCYTVSTAVIHGVRPDELANLTTMWVILGQPAGTIALPYWPIGVTPSAACGASSAPLCDIAKEIRTQLFDCVVGPTFIDTYKLRDESDQGLWALNFASEDSIFTATEDLLTEWRTTAVTDSERLNIQEDLANYALAKLQTNHEILTTITLPYTALPDKFVLHQNFPNPFNPTTIIKFNLPITSEVTLRVFNILGEEVAMIVSDRLNAGTYSFEWPRNAGMASGVYLYQLSVGSLSGETGNYVETRKMVLMR